MGVVNVHKHVEMKGKLVLGNASPAINTGSLAFFDNVLKFLGWDVEEWQKNKKKELQHK